MTDILIKLRTVEAFILQPPPPKDVPRWPIDRILHDAANEIERLRAALEKIADPDISWGHMKLIARDALNPH